MLFKILELFITFKRQTHQNLPHFNFTGLSKSSSKKLSFEDWLIHGVTVEFAVFFKLLKVDSVFLLKMDYLSFKICDSL